MCETVSDDEEQAAAAAPRDKAGAAEAAAAAAAIPPSREGRARHSAIFQRSMLAHWHANTRALLNKTASANWLKLHELKGE